MATELGSGAGTGGRGDEGPLPHSPRRSGLSRSTSQAGSPFLHWGRMGGGESQGLALHSCLSPQPPLFGLGLSAALV